MMRASRKSFIVALLAMIALSGCLEQRGARDDDVERLVNFSNWFNFIGPNTIGAFKQETGIEVNYDVYDTDEMLAAKLLVGGSGYHLVVPSSSSFARLRRSGVFQPLDWSRLRNAEEIDQELLVKLANADPGNRYAVPYAWGTTGIGVAVDRIRARMSDAPLESWALVFDPSVVVKFRDCDIALG